MLKEEKGPDVNQGAGYRKCCRNKRSDDKITIIEIRLEILEVIWKWNRHCHNHCCCPLRKNGFGVEIEGGYFAEEVYLLSRYWQRSWMCENGNDAEIGLQELTIINIERTRKYDLAVENRFDPHEVEGEANVRDR